MASLNTIDYSCKTNNIKIGGKEIKIISFVIFIQFIKITLTHISFNNKINCYK